MAKPAVGVQRETTETMTDERPKLQRRISVAIIGCGTRGKRFAEACATTGDVALVGFADPVAGSAQALAEQYGGRGFADTDEMLAATRPEFVCLVTRPSVRLQPIRACAAAGVSMVLSEKPMGTSWGEARELAEIAYRTPLRLSVFHQRRCYPPYLEARRLLKQGEIGEVRHIVAHADDLYDWGTHWFDMMHFLNEEAEAESVMAQADRTDTKTVFDQRMERCAVSVVQFANGVTGTLQAGKARGETTGLRVIGSAGTLWVSDTTMPEVFSRHGHRPGQMPCGQQLDMGVAEAITSYRERRVSPLDVHHAMKATQLIFASYQSAMLGQRVTLPLDETLDLSLFDIFPN